MASQLEAIVPDSPFAFSSSGTEASPGAAICGFTAKALHRVPNGDGFADEFNSTRLTVEGLEDAHLILTASSAVRAVMAGAAPTARSRTFTMLEATALAENLVRRNAKIGESFDVLDDPNMLAAALNNQRGLVPSHPSRRAQRAKRAQEVKRALDIPDVHTGQAQSHVEIQRAMKKTARRFAQAVATLTRSSSVIS